LRETFLCNRIGWIDFKSVQKQFARANCVSSQHLPFGKIGKSLNQLKTRMLSQ